MTKRPQDGRQLEALIAEMSDCVHNFSSERASELQMYINAIALCHQATEQGSKVLDAVAASELDSKARAIVNDHSSLSTEQTLEVLRLKVLAQVFREGFSPKINSAIAALFGRSSLPQEPKTFVTDLAAIRAEHEEEKPPCQNS